MLPVLTALATSLMTPASRSITPPSALVQSCFVSRFQSCFQYCFRSSKAHIRERVTSRQHGIRNSDFSPSDLPPSPFRPLPYSSPPSPPEEAILRHLPRQRRHGRCKAMQTLRRCGVPDTRATSDTVSSICTLHTTFQSVQRVTYLFRRESVPSNFLNPRCGVSGLPRSCLARSGLP